MSVKLNYWYLDLLLATAIQEEHVATLNQCITRTQNLVSELHFINHRDRRVMVESVWSASALGIH
jgi:hypothetical protein